MSGSMVASSDGGSALTRGWPAPRAVIGPPAGIGSSERMSVATRLGHSDEAALVRRADGGIGRRVYSAPMTDRSKVRDVARSRRSATGPGRLIDVGPVVALGLLAPGRRTGRGPGRRSR